MNKLIQLYFKRSLCYSPVLFCYITVPLFTAFEKVTEFSYFSCFAWNARIWECPSLGMFSKYCEGRGILIWDDMSEVEKLICQCVQLYTTVALSSLWKATVPMLWPLLSMWLIHISIIRFIFQIPTESWITNKECIWHTVKYTGLVTVKDWSSQDIKKVVYFNKAGIDLWKSRMW